MKFYPPVFQRNTNELFDIVSDKERWSSEIQFLAEEELISRNISRKNIEDETKIRKRNIKNDKDKKTIESNKNKIESYTIIEMICIIAFFPIILIIDKNLLSELWQLDADGYKKKIWQRILLLIIGSFIWFQVLRLFL
jgi:hypothetical protein